MSRRALFALLIAFTTTYELNAEYHLKGTKNIGYSQDKLPVANTYCLDSTAINGQNTTIHFGAAVEPSIAVNPKNPEQIVACWLQDQIDNGGALEVGIAYSSNQGESWRRSEIPMQICSGGSKQRVTSASLSWSSDGSRVYLSGIAINATAIPNTSNQETVFVSVSDDGGKSWSHPDSIGASCSTLNGAPLFARDEKVSIAIDPKNPRLAFAVWHRFAQGLSSHSDAFISRTTDGGTTWSPLRTLYNPFPDLCSLAQSNCIENDCQITKNILLALPKRDSHDKEWKKDKWGDAHNKTDRFSGDLLNFIQRKYAKPNATNSEFLNDIAVVRSQDKGKTWNPGATVITAPTDISPTIFTSDVGTQVKTDGQSLACAINRKNGFLYVVFQEDSHINLSTSRDGGYSWSMPVQINRTPDLALNAQAFAPDIAVTDDGYVGILYSDFRFDNTLNLDKTQTDKWVAIYKEVRDEHGGSTESGLDFVKEIRLTDESYVVQNGPKISHNMVNSDASAIVTHGSTFYAVYTKTHSGPFFEKTDITRDEVSATAVIADNNYRQSPYVSIIKP